MAEAVSTGKDSKRWSWKMALAPGISPCTPRGEENLAPLEVKPWSPWMTSCVAVSCGVEESSKKAVLMLAVPGKVRLVLYGRVNQCKETCFIFSGSGTHVPNVICCFQTPGAYERARIC